MERRRDIPESEYREAEKQRRVKLQTLIRTSGATPGQIARGTRLGIRVVNRALSGEGVRLDNIARIEYYIKHSLDK